MKSKKICHTTIETIGNSPRKNDDVVSFQWNIGNGFIKAIKISDGTETRISSLGYRDITWTVPVLDGSLDQVIEFLQRVRAKMTPQKRKRS